MKIDQSLSFQCRHQQAPVHINSVCIPVCTNSTSGMISSKNKSGAQGIAFSSSIKEKKTVHSLRILRGKGASKISAVVIYLAGYGYNGESNGGSE